MVECELHGLSHIALVSARLGALLESRRPASPHEVVRLRIEGEFPCGRAWADRASAGQLEGQLLSREKAWVIAPEPACSRCLEDWLRQLGVDVALSAEETRFVRLRDTLLSLLRPQLENELERLATFLRSRRHATTSGCGFDAKRSRPFEASFGFHETGECLSIALDDEGLRLVGSVTNPFFPSVAVPPPLEVRLSGGELQVAEHPLIAEWGHTVRQHLERCS